MAKYKVGDKVRIVPLSEFLACKWRNPKGKMDHWCDKVITIREVVSNDSYYMEEDIEESGFNKKPGWVWDESMIAGLAHECNISINSDDLLSFITT